MKLVARLTFACLVAVVGFMPALAAAGIVGGPYEIKSIITGGYGLHVEVAPNPSPCTASWEGTQFVVLSTQVNFQELLSTFLAAHMANKPVVIFSQVVQGTGSCSWANQIQVDAVHVKK